MAAIVQTIKTGPDYADDTEKVSGGHIATKDKEEEQEYQREGHGKLKLDADGLPLIPQPTDSPNDPLNWSRKLKYFIVFQAAVTAFFGTFSLATANPAFAQIAISLGVPIPDASYIGTVSIATAGIFCLIWVPLANVYGRRPVLLVAQAITVAAGCGSAVAESFGTIIVGRAFVGAGVAAGNVLTVNLISDIFCLHERGTFVGIATVALINGPHVAPLPGGYIAQYVGWRWTLWLPSICAGVVWVMLFFCLPETLYVRGTTEGYPEVANPIKNRMKPWGIRHPGRKLKAIHFIYPLKMLRYFPIVLQAWFTGVVFTIGSVMPALTGSALFRTYYGWQSARTGLALSLSTTIGGVLGEVIAGPVTDRLISRSRKKTGKLHHEQRLLATIPGAILLPLGLLAYGFCIHYNEAKNSYVGACIAMALTCFAVQVILSPCLSYAIDCYKPQAGEVVLLFVLARQLMSFTVGFWVIRFGNQVGFQYSGITYAVVSVLFFLPVLATMKYGEVWRHKLGTPNFNKGNQCVQTNPSTSRSLTMKENESVRAV